MREIALLLIVLLSFASCKKDDLSDVPLLKHMYKMDCERNSYFFNSPNTPPTNYIDTLIVFTAFGSAEEIVVKGDVLSRQQPADGDYILYHDAYYDVFNFFIETRLMIREDSLIFKTNESKRTTSIVRTCKCAL